MVLTQGTLKVNIQVDGIMLILFLFLLMHTFIMDFKGLCVVLSIAIVMTMKKKMFQSILCIF